MIIIKKAQNNEIISISKIHFNLFTNTLSSKLGIDFLINLYNIVFEDEKSSILVIKNSNKIIGFLSYTNNFNYTDKNISKNLPILLKIKSLLILIRNPRLIKKTIIKALFDIYLKNNIKNNSIYVLTFGIKKEYQRLGLGKKLIMRLISIAKKKNVKIFLDTELSNGGAVRFYSKMGFKIKKKILGNIIFYRD